MGIAKYVFSSSPFALLTKHARKVHDCVQLLRPLTEALFEGDREKIEELHHQMSKTEHEADEIKTEIRDQISKTMLLAVSRERLAEFLRYQDDIADAAEDFSNVLLIRKTTILPELRDDFLAFVNQVVAVTERLMSLSEELSTLAEAAFGGKEARRVLEAIQEIGEEEWKADRLQRRFARHCYSLEDRLDPITLYFYDKFCQTLSSVANSSEKTAKHLRLLIGGH